MKLMQLIYTKIEINNNNYNNKNYEVYKTNK